MRIAFLVSHFPLLSETFILNQITGLIDRGHQVDVYTCHAGDTTKMHPDVEQYRLLDRTYFLPEFPQNFVWRSLKGAGIFFSHFYQHPAKLLRSLNVLRYGKQAASLWLLYAAVAAADRAPYDIVHGQFGTLGFWGVAFRAINAPQGKLVVTFRGHDISTFVQERGDRVYDPVFRAGDFFLTNCEFFRKRLLKLGCDPSRAVVHYSGLDCKRFVFKPRRLEGDPIRIATIGRLVEKKGIEYSIRAVAKAAAAHPNLQYQIIGEGELRQPLQALIDELGMGDRIHLIGQKHQQEIIDILDQSHLFIAPSVTAQDGNQDAPINVLKEAMAIGLPVISTTHGGIPELVEDGVSGYLVPERNAEAIAHRLTELIEHPDRWAAMGQAGRDRVEQRFNLDRLNDELTALYQRLLNAPDAAQPAASTAPPIAPSPTAIDLRS